MSTHLPLSLEPTVPPSPVEPGRRVESVDTLRGVAVLGVFAMNIIAMAMPSMCYINPRLDGVAEDATTVPFWWVQHLFFEQKFITIFSMLFGAGLVFMGSRDPGRSLAGVYYSRLLWLFVLGLGHALFLWYGDILISYALCGLVLYPLRRMRPAWLITLGVLVALVALVLSSGMGWMLLYMKTTAAEAALKLEAGQSLSGQEQGMLDAWRGSEKDIAPGPEELRREIDAMRGGATSALRNNAKQLLFMQVVMFPLFTLWRGLGMMLVGMGLAKLGVFAAARSNAFYSRLAIAGFAVGFPLIVYGATRMVGHEFRLEWLYLLDGHFNYIGSMGVALGYVGAVMLMVRAGAWGGVRRRLAAVGRMALSNYLAHSVIGLLLFSGVGLGLFARFSRGELALVVAVVWTAQLLWSPWWLARFRFGPAEWLWRSLTYWKKQPMRAA